MLSLLLGVIASPVIFPTPAQMSVQEGFFSGRPRIEFVGNIKTGDQKWLKDSLRRFFPVASTGSADKLAFRIDPSVVGDEVYGLEVKPHNIELRASSVKGLYWSLQTLHQLRDGNNVPCVTIQDAPVFAWRGVMLDEGRHFLGTKFVKHFLDVMSLYKFNVMHWHLTDDQGWRIEIKSRPELTKIGAWRKEADGSRTRGFYTQEQIKEIIVYAASRNITIVPEIEMPGHISAAIATYPFLSCKQEQIEVPATWGVFGDVLCPGKESSFQFVGDVLKEVTNLFPSKYLHFGGDEVPKTNWQNCPDCQRRMKAEGLKNEEELQGYFSHRVAQVVMDMGRTPIGWDEVLKGGAPAPVVAQIWNDQNIAIDAIASGHNIILSPDSHCYLNHSPGDLPLSKVYSYNPLEGVTDASRIMGLETTLWSENITTKNCMSMFMPRGLAMSEIFWRNPTRDFPAFESRVKRHLAFLEKEGIDYGSADRDLVQYKVTPDSANASCRLDATLGLDNVELRYTLDGTAPSHSSPSAKNAIQWPVGKTLRVAPFKIGIALQEPVQFDTVTSLAYGARIALQTEPDDPYRAAGSQGLVDGLLGTNDFHDGIWLGWQGPDIVATCDLGKEQPIHEIGLHCLQQMRSWIMMPTSVHYEVSTDGVDWKPFGDVANTVKDTAEPWITQWFTVTGSARARFVRITARSYGKLPAWHNGAGGKRWIFADELAVR